MDLESSISLGRIGTELPISLSQIEERPIGLARIGKLTSTTHPELLKRISEPIPNGPPHDSHTETPNPNSSSREDLPLPSLPTISFYTENASQQAPATDPASQESSAESTSSQYCILITEAVIRDKSKTNALTKLIAVTQTTWFIVQFIERWVTHQPRTQLEVMTAAYAALNVIVYALLWHKPYSVDEPINISGRAPNLRVRTTGVWGPDSIIKNTRSIMDDVMGAIIGNGGRTEGKVTSAVLVLVGALFGGLHCFAWHYHFPTEQEAILWRVCAIFCTVAPGLGFALPYLTVERDFLDLPSAVADYWAILFLIGYIICRLVLLGLTLSCLRALPAGVFETTTWIKFIPHIS